MDSITLANDTIIQIIPTKDFALGVFPGFPNFGDNWNETGFLYSPEQNDIVGIFHKEQSIRVGIDGIQIKAGQHTVFMDDNGINFSQGGKSASISNQGISFDGVTFKAGTGSPEGVVVGNPGDFYLNKSGGAGVTFWVKEEGSFTNTGWSAR